jgi:hypothetical protein
MLRKLLIAGAASLALLSPLAVTASQAGEWRHEDRHEWRHDDCYRVFYRKGFEGGWCSAGEFHSRWRAERVAENYRHRGFEAYIR